MRVSGGEDLRLIGEHRLSGGEPKLVLHEATGSQGIFPHLLHHPRDEQVLAG
ncbi:MAG: hypothetical protein QOK02_5168, partial [Mycobacterium sp.]|nr:hypothetical protein [Mycobacterium sp.]